MWLIKNPEITTLTYDWAKVVPLGQFITIGIDSVPDTCKLSPRCTYCPCTLVPFPPYTHDPWYTKRPCTLDFLFYSNSVPVTHRALVDTFFHTRGVLIHWVPRCN